VVNRSRQDTTRPETARWAWVGLGNPPAALFERRSVCALLCIALPFFFAHGQSQEPELSVVERPASPCAEASAFVMLTPLPTLLGEIAGFHRVAA
jgi:hypothetical protein